MREKDRDFNPVPWTNLPTELFLTQSVDTIHSNNFLINSNNFNGKLIINLISRLLSETAQPQEIEHQENVV